MGPKFLGESEHGLDDKWRLTLPVRHRGLFGSGIVVTKASDACLRLYPKETFDDLDEKLDKLSSERLPVRDIIRLIYSGASELVPDKQGRIVIPAALRDYAKIRDRVVMVGVRDHVEIWNPETWKAYRESCLDNPDWRVEHLRNVDF